MQVKSKMRSRTLFACSFALATLFACGFARSAAHAQQTLVASEAHSEAAKADMFQEDVTSLNASFGGSLNTGNTEAWQLNTGSQFDLVRGRHGLSLMMAFAYGRANVADDSVDALVDTVRNLRTRARYDFFITPMDAIFLAGVYRWDTFAGLDARVQGQLGYMRNFVKIEKQRVWGELGYDLTYDNYDPDPLLDDMGNRLPSHEVVHSIRGFVGYDNQLNDALTFLTGVEGLVNVEDTKDFRLAWDSALRSAIGKSFKLEMKLSVALDTQPVPGTKKVDTTTIVNLIYSLL